MKKNLVALFGLSRWGVGAVALALCAFAPASRADVVVNNTGDATFTQLGGSEFAQVFTMSGTSGNISSLTLDLYSTAGGTVNVDLYGTSSGQPNGSATLLGTVTAGTSGGGQLISVSGLNNVLLTSGTQYAIALEYNSSVQWEYTLTGGVGSIYSSTDNGVSWGVYGGSGSLQMNLQTTPVPEVPMTGIVMGFGALAIAVGGILRRKMRTAVSSIA